MKECIFCGVSGKKSREHVFANWLLKELGLRGDPFNMSHITIAGVTKSRRIHSLDSFVNKRICKGCNGGWMKKLEDSSRNWIIRLMNLDGVDEKSFWDDLRKNYKTLAKWAFKTAIVLNYSSNYRKIVPEDHLHLIYCSKIPNGVHINIAFTNSNKELEWRQSQGHGVIFFCPRDEMQKRLSQVRSAYKMTLQLKHLLVRVCYIPLKDFIQDYRSEASIALWPQFGRYEKTRFYEDIAEFDLGVAFMKRQ